MNPETQVRKIRSIRCMEELRGYEQEAKKRGLIPEETRALAEKRRELKSDD